MKGVIGVIVLEAAPPTSVDTTDNCGCGSGGFVLGAETSRCTLEALLSTGSGSTAASGNGVTGGGLTYKHRPTVATEGGPAISGMSVSAHPTAAKDPAMEAAMEPAAEPSPAARCCSSNHRP